MRIVPVLLAELAQASLTCDTTELELPKNGKRWICDEGNDGIVPDKRKCVLECEDGYTVEKMFRRDFHRCKNGEWFKPSRVLLRCTRDFDDALKILEAEVAALANNAIEESEKVNEAIESLNNNNLMGSCTYQGETSDWKVFNSVGIFVTVDTSNTDIQEITRINTWLSCEWRCWDATGSNQVYLNPSMPDQFKVYLRQSGLGLEMAANNKYVLHYEIEGTCGANLS